jgi:hypothetical protein
MTDRELLQQALVWLDDKEGAYTEEYQKFLDAIRTRLAQLEPEETIDGWPLYSGIPKPKEKNT